MRINLLLLILGVTCHLFGQTTTSDVRVRKNYREMTAAEKQMYVEATIALKKSGISNTYAEYHSYNAITGNSEQLIPWHRWFLHHYEQELRKSGVPGASKISLPYWDWTSEFYANASQSKDYTREAPLFASDFLGNATILSWNLNRRSDTEELFGSNRVQAKNRALLCTKFGFDASSFSYELENALENPTHLWIGGVMGGLLAPNDPVFYLHHSHLDKLWQDWENISGNTTVASLGNLIHFPIGVPSISPSLISDGARSSLTKTWFAENQKLILDNYTSTETENYDYTGTIEVGVRGVSSAEMVSTDGTTYVRNFETGNFVVPSGTTVRLMSGAEVILKPGFEAKEGSNFRAYINSNYFNSASASAREGEEEPIVSTPSSIEPLSAGNIVVFPNPGNGLFKFLLLTNGDCVYSYEVLDNLGTIVQTEEMDTNTDGHQWEVDLREKAKGIYHARVTLNGTVISQKLIVQ